MYARRALLEYQKNLSNFKVVFFYDTSNTHIHPVFGPGGGGKELGFLRLEQWLHPFF